MEKTNKFKEFIKKNLAYLVLAFCIIAVGLSVALVLSKNKDKMSESIVLNNDSEQTSKEDESDIQVITEPEKETPVVETVDYILPVANATSVTEYSEALSYNQTLKRYASHLAVDFFAEEGSNVVAIKDGVIESIDNTLIYGTTIVIDHGDGIKSIYNSLQDGESVQVGQKVKQGDIIGKVSVTNRQEYKEGAHLHFSMKANGNIVDPASYISLNEK